MPGAYSSIGLGRGLLIVPEQTGNFRGQARWTSLRTLAGAGDGHQVIKDVLAHVTDHHEHADRKQSLNDSRKTALSGLVGKELLEAPARRPFARCRMNSGYQGVRMAPNRGGHQEATKGSVVATPFAPQLQVLHSVRSCAQDHTNAMTEHGRQQHAGKAETADCIATVQQGAGAGGFVDATPGLVTSSNASYAQRLHLQVDRSVDATPPAIAPASAKCSHVGRFASLVQRRSGTLARLPGLHSPIHHWLGQQAGGLLRSC